MEIAILTLSGIILYQQWVLQQIKETVIVIAEAHNDFVDNTQENFKAIQNAIVDIAEELEE